MDEKEDKSLFFLINEKERKRKERMKEQYNSYANELQYNKKISNLIKICLIKTKENRYMIKKKEKVKKEKEKSLSNAKMKKDYSENFQN